MKIAETSARGLWTQETIGAIAHQMWADLIGTGDFLAVLQGSPPLSFQDSSSESVIAWVRVEGAWRGGIALTCALHVAADLTRALLGDRAPEDLEFEDLTDGFGQLAHDLGAALVALLPVNCRITPARVSAPPAASSPLTWPEAVRSSETTAVEDAPDSALSRPDEQRVSIVWRGERIDIDAIGPFPPH